MKKESSEEEGIPGLEDLDQTLINTPKLLIMVALYLFGPLYESSLAKMLGLTWGRLSTHLAGLEKAGYIERRRTLAPDRPRVVVSITKKGSAALIETLDALIKLRSKLV